MPLKAMIIDDEPFARDDLRYMLAAHEDIEVAWEAGKFDEAKSQLMSAVNLDPKEIKPRLELVRFHINRKAYEQWDDDLERWLPMFHVERSDIQRHAISECWICERS